MVKIRVREVTIKDTEGTFRFLRGKDKYDFESLSSLRKLLSREKAKLLDVVKYKEPSSIYDLAKILDRPFKAVIDDVKLLERFGFLEIVKEKVNNRQRHKPKIVVDEVVIHLKI